MMTVRVYTEKIHTTGCIKLVSETERGAWEVTGALNKYVWETYIIIQWRNYVSWKEDYVTLLFSPPAPSSLFQASKIKNS